MIGLLVILAGLGVFVTATVAIVRRAEWRLRPGPRNTAGLASPSDDPVGSYVDRVAASLALPAADVRDVRAELLDHLGDSIATLEDEGFSHDDAVREAVGRLGPAPELGRQLSAAHQSTRRLLAGAGGGVFAAAGGFVVGYLGGIGASLLMFIGAFLAAGLLAKVGFAPDLTGPDNGSTANSLLISMTIAVAAATSIRFAVRTSAGLSRRAPKTVAGFWALAGVVVFGWLAIFGVSGQQSWYSIPIELAVPFIAVAAAFCRIDRPMPHIARWAIASFAVLVIVTVAVLGMATQTTTGSDAGAFNGPEPDMHFDLVAAPAPAAWLGEGDLSDSGSSEATGSFGTTFSIDLSRGASANWHDLRFEAWHGLPNGDGIDTRYTAAFLIQPVSSEDSTLTATLHFERIRQPGSWWVFLTGVGPDGRRYSLDNSGGGTSTFNGSAWDWITAPQ
jgi:hypothetical protein